MNIFDFITEDEIEGLPDDDPQAAFTSFVRIAQRRLGARVAELDSQDDSWRQVNDARHGFMNVVIAAAKKYEIEPFASLSVPRLEKFDDETHRQFRADLDHYLTQLVLDNASRAKRDSVFVSPELKGTIRTYVHHLRTAIDNDESLSDGKRSALLLKLAEFEAELEKKRLSLLAVTLVTLALLSGPGGIAQTGEMTTKLLTNIWRAVAEAKVADDETRRLPSAAAPMAITGPRKEDDAALSPTKTDMDDEIPF